MASGAREKRRSPLSPPDENTERILPMNDEPTSELLNQVADTINTDEVQPPTGPMRVLVTGSPSFDVYEAVPRTLTNWWNSQPEGTEAILVVEQDTPVGSLAQAAWANMGTNMPIEVHPHRHDDSGRADERARVQRIIGSGLAEVFLFLDGADDNGGQAWFLALQSSGARATLMSVDRYTL